MKTFKIPVTWEEYGYVEIEANSIEEALEYANKNIDELPLPDDNHYVDGSYVIEQDIEVIKLLNN